MNYLVPLHKLHRLFNVEVDEGIVIVRLAEECPAVSLRRNSQIFTFFINLSYPRAHHRPNHSIGIVEYHKSISFTQESLSLQYRLQ
jgi:hypothetical protein